ncbi:MAG TPA: hypothetical protein VGH99_13470 [Pseudonocardia sp.]
MELYWLEDIARASGPFATVYLDARHDKTDSEHRIQVRWRDSRRQLADDGADEASLAALDDVVESLARAEGEAGPRTGRMLVAAAGKVLLDQALSYAPDPPTARWAPLPHLAPLLTDMPEDMATVVAVVDRVGADIHSGRRTGTVDAARYPLHEVRGGGLSHWSMSQRVQQKEREAAEEIAEALETEVAAAGAGLLVLAGEVQTRARVRKALSGRAARIAVETEVGGRAAGTDDEALDRDVADRVTDRIARLRESAADRFEVAAGSDGAAVDGIQAVAEAFQAAQVEVLYLDAGAARETPLWVSDEPTQLAADQARLTGLGLTATGPVDPADALIRAAAASGAELYPIGGGHTALVGRPLQDGVGAILRSADAAGSAVGSS